MSALLELAARCEAAAAAYERTMSLLDKGGISSDALAIAAGMVLSLHGHLFGECAAALRARAAQSGEQP